MKKTVPIMVLPVELARGALVSGFTCSDGLDLDWSGTMKTKILRIMLF